MFRMERIDRRLHVLFIIVFAFFFGSCSYPYDDPVLEEPGTDNSNVEFDGLSDLARNVQGRLKVAIVHGICDHGVLWVDRRLGILANNLEIAKPPVTTLDRVEGIDRYRAILESPEIGQIQLDFLVWSPLTDSIKDTIDYDAPPSAVGGPSGQNTRPNGMFPFERATLNNELKVSLMNRCMADAVIYSGPSGDMIRRAMAVNLCEFILGGTIDERGRCQFAEQRQSSALAIMGESMGSKLIFDAVRTLNRMAAGDPAAVQALEEAIGRTLGIYMISNQLPLLDLAGDPSQSEPVTMSRADARSSSIQGFLDVLAAGRRTLQSEDPEFIERHGELEIIAFTDPNDLLSYRLLPDKLSIDESNVRLINVIVTNSPTWFGFVALPNEAHAGYEINEDVINLLLFGNHVM